MLGQGEEDAQNSEGSSLDDPQAGPPQGGYEDRQATVHDQYCFSQERGQHTQLACEAFAALNGPAAAAALPLGQICVAKGLSHAVLICPSCQSEACQAGCPRHKLSVPHQVRGSLSTWSGPAPKQQQK